MIDMDRSFDRTEQNFSIHQIQILLDELISIHFYIRKHRMSVTRPS